MWRCAAAASIVSTLILATFVGLLIKAQPGIAISPMTLTTSHIEIPPESGGAQMVYDAESDRIILFGGASTGAGDIGLAETWVYDMQNNSWNNMNPTSRPPGRLAHGMTYDSKADRVILFGGWDVSWGYGLSAIFNDTWTYDLNTNIWTNMAPSVSPPKRMEGQLVYDFRLDRTILFGGHILEPDYLAKNDTWMYDLNNNTWAQLVMATSPPPLGGPPALAYDAESDRVVLFGGEPSSYGHMSSDCNWVFDPANETWVEMTPASRPSSRLACGGVYDAKADRVLLYGGASGSGAMNTTWAYDLNANTWSEIVTASRPSNRLAFAMAYNAKSDRTALFGGFGTGWPEDSSANNETWVFDYGNSTWTIVLPDIVNPTLEITSPVDGASLTSKNVNVSGAASDNLEIAKVEVSLDNAKWITANGTTSWFATLSLAEGKNTIYVRVTDTSGNTAVSTIHVTVAAKGIPVWVWPLGLVGVIVLVAAIYVILRRRRPAQ